MARETGNIKSAAINEAFRVAFFLVYYIALICLGVAIMVGAVYAAKVLFADVIPGMRNGRAVVWIAVVAVGLLAMAAVFGIYLVKPLFSFTKCKRDDWVEVSKRDCPRLFALIEDLARTTGFRMPRHVYLTTDVNAGVFYNTSFWSIFLPVRKNLEIGLGLFNSTTIQEVKAVLAHEFGHFGQSSMKIGSAVSVTNVVLSNLIDSNDFVDRALESWRNAGWPVWRFFGIVASGMTLGVKFVTVGVFKFVLRGERKLSRLMEFGADEVACRCAGSSAFVSAMCKIDYLADIPHTRFMELLYEVVAEKKCPENCFLAYNVVASALGREGKPLVAVEERLKRPLDLGAVKSRLVVKDVMGTHPELQDRLECAQELALECGEEELEPAWSLIPDEVAQKVSDQYLAMAESGAEHKLERISIDEFRQAVERSQAKYGYPLAFEPFFRRVFEHFDLPRALDEEESENPFTDEYRRLIAELDTAKSDMAILAKIVSGETEVETFLYNGIAYSRKQAPVEMHHRYLEELQAKVARLDSRACSYLCRLGDESDRQRIRTIYEKLEKWWVLSEEVSKALSAHDEGMAKYFAKERLEPKEYLKLCVQVVELEKTFGQGVLKIRRELPEWIPENDRGRRLLAYVETIHNSKEEFSPEQFQQLQNMRGLMDELAREFYHGCHQELARFAERKCLGKQV